MRPDTSLFCNQEKLHISQNITPVQEDSPSREDINDVLPAWQLAHTTGVRLALKGLR